MIYTYLIPSKEYYFGNGVVKFDCETKELYYVNYVTDKHVSKRSASLRNFWDLIKSLSSTKHTTSRFWKKPYYER